MTCEVSLAFKWKLPQYQSLPKALSILWEHCQGGIQPMQFSVSSPFCNEFEKFTFLEFLRFYHMTNSSRCRHFQPLTAILTTTHRLAWSHLPCPAQGSWSGQLLAEALSDVTAVRRQVFGALQWLEPKFCSGKFHQKSKYRYYDKTK